MGGSFISETRSLQRKCGTFFLAFFWVSGLVLGILLYLFAELPIFPKMYVGSSTDVSIVSLLFSLFLPFSLSALAVLYSRSVILYLISFFKAFVFSFVSLWIMDSFGSAGWLIHRLFMFSSIASFPVLYFYNVRSFSKNRILSLAEHFVIFSYCFFIGSIDCHFVIPALGRLNIF